jgi:hypothetical protein
MRPGRRLLIPLPQAARLWASAAALVLLCTSLLHAKEVEEKFDDGTVHLRYEVDLEGHKNGDYQEFAEGGKLKVHGAYAADKKTGTWTTYDEQGKPSEVAHWRDGMLDGPFRLVFPFGRAQMQAVYRANEFLGPITTFDEEGHTLLQVSYPRPLAEVMRVWNTLVPASRDAPKFVEEPSPAAPYVAGKMTAESLTAAANYVMLYRWMCGLPERKMRIDPGLCDLAQHGAVLVAKLGHLSHEPDKPADMDDAFFKLGYAGCNQSNLYQGLPTLFDAIDAFMSDSDDSNVQKIGHRQWVLSPGLERTGFGSVDGFTAMHVITADDGGNNYTFIAYPGPGYYPTKLLADGAAWSVHLNIFKARVGSAEEVKVFIVELDDHFAAGQESAAKVVSVLSNDTANWTTIVFKPGRASFPPGKYLVKITGVYTRYGVAKPFSYLVDLRQMPDVTPPADQPRSPAN